MMQNLTASGPATCTCDVLQYGPAGSFFYSTIGIVCPACEAAQWEREQQDDWLALSPAERIGYRWQAAQLSIRELGGMRMRPPLPGNRQYDDPWATPF